MTVWLKRAQLFIFNRFHANTLFSAFASPRRLIGNMTNGWCVTLNIVRLCWQLAIVCIWTSGGAACASPHQGKMKPVFRAVIFFFFFCSCSLLLWAMKTTCIYILIGSLFGFFFFNQCYPQSHLTRHFFFTFQIKYFFLGGRLPGNHSCMILLFNLLPRLRSFNIYDRTCLLQLAPATETAFDVLNRAHPFLGFCCFFLFFFFLPRQNQPCLWQEQTLSLLQWDDSSNYFKKYRSPETAPHSPRPRSCDFEPRVRASWFFFFGRSFDSAMCNHILFTIIQSQPTVRANLCGINVRNVHFPPTPVFVRRLIIVWNHGSPASWK